MGMKFTLYTEDGRRDLDYVDYLLDDALMLKVGDKRRLFLNLGSTILSYDRDWLTENPTEKARVDALCAIQDDNPLQFFKPSGGGATDFLNDRTSSVKMLVSGNRRGKTATGIIDILLDAIPCNPDWAIFKLHGVKYREWTGPKKIGFATSDWNVMQRVLWEEIVRWVPKAELGEYNPRLRGAREISWRVRPENVLTCGSVFYYFCYEQKQGPFEGQALHQWYWDEQGEEAKFDGADERVRTLRGRHTFGLTPHKVEGRPDTGARSWIHKMLKGVRTKGHTIGVYSILPDDVPDWVYPEAEKRKAYEKWVLEPARQQNLKALKEGRSRYFGDWHDVGGLIYDEWDENVHVIEDFEIPDSWTRYRAIDHGEVNPMACLWGAVSPEGDLYLYREYYRRGLTVYDNCANIITASGNAVISTGTTSVGKGIFYERFAERFTGEQYHKTVLDSRSFAMGQPIVGLTLGQLYQWGGLRCQPAAGYNGETTIPIVKQWLVVDQTRYHPRSGKLGAPRCFVFHSLVEFRREIAEYAFAEFKSEKAAMGSNPKEKAISKDDHLMDCLKFMCQIPPRHIEGRWAFKGPVVVKEKDDDEEIEDARPARRFDRFTGY